MSVSGYKYVLPYGQLEYICFSLFNRKMKNRINTQKVEDFISLQNDLLSIANKYDINISALCRTVGMSRSTFYKKQKEVTFTALEMKKICDYINR